MDDVWFKEELLPPGSGFDAPRAPSAPLAKWSEVHGDGSTPADDNARRAARAILRVDPPRWGPVDKAQQVLSSGSGSRFILVRFSFQLDLSEALRRQGGLFTYARYSTYLWPRAEGEPIPQVYEIMPRDLFEGEPRRVSVKLAPKISLGPADVGAGEIGTDFTLGYVEPVVVGWPGEDSRAPYWELRPQTKNLIGTRYFWAIIELPVGSSGVQVASKLEGEVQSRLWNPIPLGPRKRDWTERPRETIGVMPE
jgi:hypothetical protein